MSKTRTSAGSSLGNAAKSGRSGAHGVSAATIDSSHRAAAAPASRREGATPIEDAGLSQGTLDRVARAGLETLEEIAELREWELFRRGLWLGDVRKIVAALSRNGLSLREGTLGGPARSTRGTSFPRPVRHGSRARKEAASRRDARDAAIVAARVQGDTLQEAGAPFGLSRERVRQILAGIDAAHTESSRSARARRQDAAAELRREEVLSAWRAGAPVIEIAKDTALPRGAVRALVARHATARDRDARRRVLFTSARCRRPAGYSDEELVEAVRAAVQNVGHIPSSKQYGQVAKSSGLPSLSTVENRFGGWNAALRAAGFTPTPAKGRLYERHWTEESCLQALRDLVAELGSLPSQDAYRRLSPQRADLPSSSTVRVRLGTWTTVASRLEREADGRTP
jgi:hypothetical protein